MVIRSMIQKKGHFLISLLIRYSSKDMQYKVLLVDDEPDILEFLSYNLKKENYIVSTALNGQLAIEQAKKDAPHLIVLDVMMPGIDGIETCKELKKIDGLKNTLIVFLTARAEDYSMIAGLDAGADDYISKPIKPRVFTAKISSILRRLSPTPLTPSSADQTGLFIDKESYIVVFEGQKITMPRKEFELLDLLHSKPGKVFKRDEILSKVWGDDVIVGDRTIDVHIRKLREKLGSQIIKTVKGVGYKFEV